MRRTGRSCYWSSGRQEVAVEQHSTRPEEYSRGPEYGPDLGSIEPVESKRRHNRVEAISFEIRGPRLLAKVRQHPLYPRSVPAERDLTYLHQDGVGVHRDHVAAGESP